MGCNVADKFCEQLEWPAWEGQAVTGEFCKLVERPVWEAPSCGGNSHPAMRMRILYTVAILILRNYKKILILLYSG